MALYCPKISRSPFVTDATPVSECNPLVRVYSRTWVPWSYRGAISNRGSTLEFKITSAPFSLAESTDRVSRMVNWVNSELCYDGQ